MKNRLNGYCFISLLVLYKVLQHFRFRFTYTFTRYSEAGRSLNSCNVHFSPRVTLQEPCHMCGNPTSGASRRTLKNMTASPRRGATRRMSAVRARRHMALAALAASGSKLSRDLRERDQLKN